MPRTATLFATVAATACIGVAAVVVAGWAFGMPALTTLGRAWTPMVVNTALGVWCGATAILLLARRATGKRPWRIIRALGAVMAVMGGLVLADFGSVWLTGTPLYPPAPAWRMAPNTAVANVCIGLALALSGRSVRVTRVAEALIAAALIVAAVMLVAFLMGATAQSDLMGRVNMSPITGLCLATIAATLLVVMPDAVLGSIVWGDGPGSRIARPLLLTAVLAPTFLGWFSVAAERRGWMTLEYGIALTVLGTAIVATGAVIRGAMRVNSYDARRAEAEDSLRALAAGLETQVARRTAELTATNRELESFSYSVSHDLRTPLRALDGFSQALLEDYSDRLDDTGRDYLGRIRRGTQRMGELIDALLDLSRVSRAQLQRAQVDLSALATDVAATLREREPGRHVLVQVTPGLSAEGDPRLLRALLENLMANAWKFTSRRPDALIEFTAIREDGRPDPVYVLRDNGAGFDMAHAAKLFGAFQRLHTEREFQGTGVGLATAQRIVHRHGGEIWAEGIAGQGAAFFFTLAEDLQT
jgi:signal transduction histidine kinase